MYILRICSETALARYSGGDVGSQGQVFVLLFGGCLHFRFSCLFVFVKSHVLRCLYYRPGNRSELGFGLVFDESLLHYDFLLFATPLRHAAFILHWKFDFFESCAVDRKIALTPLERAFAQV